MSITKLGNFIQNTTNLASRPKLQSFDMNDLIVDDAIEFMSKNSNTFKQLGEPKLIGKEIHSLKEACEYVEKLGIKPAPVCQDYVSELDLYI